MKKLSGSKVVNVTTHFENIVIHTDDYNSYYIDKKELLAVLNEFDFVIKKKRVREYAHPVLPTVNSIYDK